MSLYISDLVDCESDGDFPESLISLFTATIILNRVAFPHFSCETGLFFKLTELPFFQDSHFECWSV